MATFGRFLLARRVLDRAQLAEATHVMVVFGGRLGSILVEAGLLTTEQVERHLSSHLGLPSAPSERLLRPDPAALRRVPRDVARRHRLLPLWIEKRRLHVAMLDPGFPDRIDALAFAVGLPIVPYVIAERRLVALLEEHYGIRPDRRFGDPELLELAGHLGSAHERDEPGRVAAVVDPEEDERLRWLDAHGLRPLAEGEELSDPTPAREPGSPAAAAPAKLAPARSATERAALEADLAMTGDRDSVVPTALRIAASLGRTAAMFAVRDGAIHGVLAAGGAPGPSPDALCVPVGEPGMLGSAARGAVFHGRPTASGADAQVARAVGGGEVREAAVVPIAVRGRVVQLLYLDNGSDPLPASALPALGALCDDVAAAYGRLIVECTRQHC